ncbi:MAG TPA: hypothetical protein VNJ07_03010, partial [Chitinophagales bacterium]|nr:hypothetical protein [Chitinophagales bacterium]
YANQRVLQMSQNGQLVSDTAVIKDAVVVAPCYIGRNVHIAQSVIGPHVSIGDNSDVRHSVISNSIIQNHTRIENKIISNSMIGSHVQLIAPPEEASIGDYTTMK